MANATATLTVKAYPYGVDNTQRRQILNGTCVLLSGGTYVTGGIPVAWDALKNGEFASGTFQQQTGPWDVNPLKAEFFSVGGGETTIPPYAYIYDSTNVTLRIMDTSTGLELASAAAITADTIQFEATFLRGI